MNKYELCLVLNANLDEEQKSSDVEKVKSYITRFGGNVIEPIEDWGKKKLAYTINHMKEGFYYFIQFEGNTTTPGELENNVRIMENVIRFLIVKQEA